MKGFSTRARGGLVAALLSAVTACALAASPAPAAPSAAGPRLGHLEVGQALRPGSVRSPAEATSSGYCRAELSWFEYAECPPLSPPGAEMENTSPEDDGLTLDHCSQQEFPCVTSLRNGFALFLDEPGEKGLLTVYKGEGVVMEGHYWLGAPTLEASIVSSSAAEWALTPLAQAAPGHPASSGADERRSAVLARLQAQEGKANAAIDRFGRRRAGPAAVRGKLAAAGSSATSLAGLLRTQQPRNRQEAKVKAALLGALRGEAGACRELDAALSGAGAGGAEARSIGHANRALRKAASEARGAVRTVVSG